MTRISFAVFAAIAFMFLSATHPAQAQGGNAPRSEARTAAGVDSGGNWPGGRNWRLPIRIGEGYAAFDAEVDDAIEMAESAIRNCDQAKFNSAMNWLDDLAYDAPDDDDEEDIDDIMDDLARDWKRLSCSKAAKNYHYGLSFGGKAGVLSFSGLPGFFGTENGGGGNRVLGVINTDDSGTYSEFGGGLRLMLNDSPPPNLWPNLFNNTHTYEQPRRSMLDMFAGFNVARADFTGGAPDQFDPGTQTLLIPGTGVGANAAGFSVAAPNGLVNNIMYDYEYNRTSYRAGLGHTLTIDIKNQTEVRTYAGLEYSRAKVSEVFMASVPNVAIDVTYDTDIENFAWSPYIGIEGSIRPQWLKDIAKADIALNGGLRYAYNFNDADGVDDLTVTGQNTDPADLSEGRNTHSFGASVGFTVNPDGPVSFTLGGEYERIGNAMKVTRDGQSPSNLSFDEADVWAVGSQFKFRF